MGGVQRVGDADLLKAARDLLPDPNRPIESIGRLLHVPPGMLNNHIPDLKELRAAGRARPAAETTGGSR